MGMSLWINTRTLTFTFGVHRWDMTALVFMLVIGFWPLPHVKEAGLHRMFPPEEGVDND